MLHINTVLEFQHEIASMLIEANGKKLFNYVDMVIDDSELSKVLEERVPEDNTFFISVVPEHYIKGDEDNMVIENPMKFFILDKTDYSEHDRDTFRQIFVETQIKAEKLIKKMIELRTSTNSAICSILDWINYNSIQIIPVWKKNQCNGWLIEFTIYTYL